MEFNTKVNLSGKDFPVESIWVSEGKAGLKGFYPSTLKKASIFNLFEG